MMSSMLWYNLWLWLPFHRSILHVEITWLTLLFENLQFFLYYIFSCFLLDPVCHCMKPCSGKNGILCCVLAFEIDYSIYPKTTRCFTRQLCFHKHVCLAQVRLLTRILDLFLDTPKPKVYIGYDGSMMQLCHPNAMPWAWCIHKI